MEDKRDLSVGAKYDTGKDRIELVPPESVYAMANIFTFGAQKYDDRNWEKGIKWSRVFGAAMRHLWAWWGGRQKTTHNFVFGDLDLETSKSHLWHALTCIAMLVAYEERGMTDYDDRYNPDLPIEE